MKTALEHFQKAVEKDPGFDLAFIGLADTYNRLPVYSNMAPRDAFPLAKTAAHRALQLDDRLTEGHASLAWALAGEWQWSDAAREYQQAIALNPEGD